MFKHVIKFMVWRKSSIVACVTKVVVLYFFSPISWPTPSPKEITTTTTTTNLFYCSNYYYHTYFSQLSILHLLNGNTFNESHLYISIFN